MGNLVTLLSQPALAIWLLKATLLLVAAIAATSVLRRASAGTRHLVWVSTLAGILLLPPLSLWTPIRLAVLPSSLIRVELPREPISSVTTRFNTAAQHTPAVESRASVTEGVRRASATTNAPIPASALSDNEHRLSLWTALVLVWGVVCAALVAWLTFGALSVRRIVRTGRSLDDDRAWSAPLCEIADRLDLDAVPRLVESDRIEMPFACGLVQPTVVLPATAEQWSDSRRRAVLFHELAHVKRHDLLGHTVGRLACALYWFHPLVWTAARHLRAESERACDDLVLSCGARASDYADHLLDIVISVRRYGAPATAMPMARRRELEGRVLAILDPAVRRIGPGRLQSLGLVSTLGILALCIAATSPVEHMVPDAGRAARTDQAHQIAAVVSASPSIEPKQSFASPARTKTVSAVTGPGVLAAPAPTPSPAPAPTPHTSIMSDSVIAHPLGGLTTVAVRAAVSAIASAAGGAKTGQAAHADSGKVALLLKVLRSDQDASVRRMAAWGLSEAGDEPEIVAALADAVRNDDDAEVREMAAWALSDSHRASARRALADALRRDESSEVRETAAWALGNGDAEEERGALETALTSDQSAEVRESAAWGLGYAPRRPASHALVVALGDRSPEVRETAAWALAETQDEDTAPALTEAFLKETSAAVRMAELRALTFLHVNDKEVLDAALSSRDAELRARAVRMLAGAGGSWPEPRPRPRPRPMP